MKGYLRVSSTITKILRNPMVQFQENTQTDGKTERKTLHRTPPATPGGPSSTTAAEWHLKFKVIERSVGLTKNYCITISMQNISSIHKFDLKACVCYKFCPKNWGNGPKLEFFELKKKFSH